jgi:hypothetical protein
MSVNHRLLIVAVVALFSSAAQADTIYVDDDNCPGPGSGIEADPYCSIQTAIENAVDTDEIVVAPGTYFESWINLLGKAVTLRSSHGPEATIIDAQQMGTAVLCGNTEGPDTILEGFTITGGSAYYGGGMTNSYSNPTVIQCIFNENEAASGAGMFNSHSSPTVTDCTFSSNTAYGLPVEAPGGGGMLNWNDSEPTVTDCTFAENSAFNGGGMHNLNGSPVVTNCTFEGNTADQDGGGMSNSGSSPTVGNTTFTGNMASVGNALSFDSYQQQYPSNLVIANCIMWDGGNEIWNNDGSTITTTYSDVQGGWPGTGNIDADPQFVDPDNGDYRLSPGSPCVDAADNTAVPDGVTTDLDGNPRFVDDPGTVDTGSGDPPIVDMGAYEFQGLPCPWDLNGNGFVGILDFLVLLFSWGPCDDPGNCPADFDGNGFVGVMDFLDLLCHWGPCP